MLLPKDLALDAFVSTYALSIAVDLGRSLIECVLNFIKDKRQHIPLTSDECTFIIPCHNSGSFLKSTINSLPTGYTVYCVANACTDNTEDVISSNPRATLISTENPGKIQAVFLGAQKAQKDGFSHFVLLDDDILWPKDEKGDIPLTTFSKDISCTALPVIPSLSCKNWIVYSQYIEYGLMVVSKRGQAILGNVIMASGAAGIFKVEDFLHAMTLHDGEHVGDDLQTAFIFHTLGYKIDFNPDIVIKTEPPETVKSWWKQRTKRWEPSPVFNFVWHLKVICAAPGVGPGWWIRSIAFYRLMVLNLDIMRFLTIPYVLVYRPALLLGVLAIVYFSLILKVFVFKRYFAKDASIKLWSLLSYPLYGALCWFSRIFSVPRGLMLFCKYWVLRQRQPIQGGLS